MKAIRPALLAACMLLTGCASSPSQPESTSSSTGWNPVSWSWSSLSPLNWFSSPLQVSERGVGGINGNTPLQQQALSDGLNGNYQLRQGMRTADGNIVHFWQAVNSDKQVRLELTGQSTVSRVDISDRAIATVSGVKIGTPFSDLFKKAFDNCQKGSGADSASVECKAPGSQHISYVFSGDWHGPDGLIPADQTLKNWTLSKIIWRR
ncbi:RpoE-regulated lipoprotein [Erwinia pyrifoliae]|uniref:RpoE-regulated lipoprotein n=1 Tax=Erwinia pyrifoliae TaxID=79967 RepID=UPI00220D65A1|nr:RpoE-regulated lipoprotein [Erwinia pyrifoliae]UWS31685.1 RpoE-regulated lipoprotein [Erwinia pyrifoliae]UXK11261.1 RpoE-regulated lipoprotein [Erwinia pyrifoliae]